MLLYVSLVWVFLKQGCSRSRILRHISEYKPLIIFNSLVVERPLSLLIGCFLQNTFLQFLDIRYLHIAVLDVGG